MCSVAACLLRVRFARLVNLTQKDYRLLQVRQHRFGAAVAMEVRDFYPALSSARDTNDRSRHKRGIERDECERDGLFDL